MLPHQNTQLPTNHYESTLPSPSHSLHTPQRMAISTPPQKMPSHTLYFSQNQAPEKDMHLSVPECSNIWHARGKTG